MRCLLEFEDGAAGSFGFNGYGHFDVRDLTWGIGVTAGSNRRCTPRDRGARVRSILTKNMAKPPRNRRRAAKDAARSCRSSVLPS